MAQIVTITNPLTGQPAQVDQLEHTAQEIDDAIARALPGGAIDIALQNKADKDRVVNPNLLDNWYFGNPVDQRDGYVVPPGVAYAGASSGTTTKYYTVKATYIYNDVKYAVFDVDGSECNVPFYACVRGYTGSGYGIDRWEANELVITDDGVIVKPNSYFNQKFTFDTTNKTFTMSVLTADNILSAYTFKLGSDAFYYNEVVNGIRLELYNNPNGTNYFMAFPTESSKIFNAVKLELGSQQTLAHQENGNWVLNEIPDYGEQLRRCQVYDYMSNPDLETRGSMIRISPGLHYIPFKCTMRAVPGISLLGSETDYFEAILVSKNGFILHNKDTVNTRSCDFEANANL